MTDQKQQEEIRFLWADPEVDLPANGAVLYKTKGNEFEKQYALIPLDQWKEIVGFLNDMKKLLQLHGKPIAGIIDTPMTHMLDRINDLKIL